MATRKHKWWYIHGDLPLLNHAVLGHLPSSPAPLRFSERQRSRRERGVACGQLGHEAHDSAASAAESWGVVGWVVFFLVLILCIEE